METQFTDSLRQWYKENLVTRPAPLIEQLHAPELLAEVEDMWSNWKLKTDAVKEAAQEKARALNHSLSIGTHSSAVEQFKSRAQHSDETRQR